jgi:hypothetical protein
MLNRLRTLALLLSCPLVTFGAGSPTTTSLTTSAPASAIFGAPLTLTATVSGLAVTGRVTLYDNANVPGSAAVSGGKATPVALASADLNGDGKTDVAVVGGAQGVRILLGNGDGSLRPPSVYQPDGYGIVTADFNGDGKTDLATAAFDVEQAFGNGDASFQPLSTYETPGATQRRNKD